MNNRLEMLRRTAAKVAQFLGPQGELEGYP